MRRVWIVGAKGHVGQALQQLLDKMKYKIYTTDKDDVDVSDRHAVSTFMAMNRPDVVRKIRMKRIGSMRLEQEILRLKQLHTNAD